MSLPLPAPMGVIHYDEDGAVVTEFAYTADQLREYGQQCRADLIALVTAVHKAKGRYHSQIAMCDLYDACGLSNTRPTK